MLSLDILDFLRLSHLLCSLGILYSLQALHKKLLSGKTFQCQKKADDVVNGGYWHFDIEVVNAVWTLVRMCGSDDMNDARSLVFDFIARVLYLSFLSLVLYCYQNSRVLHSKA